MKFVSIDSSLRNTGVAIGTITGDKEILVEKIELHQTQKSTNKQVRASSDTIASCRSTYLFVQAIVNSVEPVFVFAETPSGSKSFSAGKSYGATCQLIASLMPAPIEVTPTEVKKVVTGTNTASKDTVINWANEKYPDLDWLSKGGKLLNKNEHLADAIAIAHAAIKTDEFNRLFHYLSKK